jgi:hypothetical protein
MNRSEFPPFNKDRLQAACEETRVRDAPDVPSPSAGRNPERFTRASALCA